MQLGEAAQTPTLSPYCCSDIPNIPGPASGPLHLPFPLPKPPLPPCLLLEGPSLRAGLSLDTPHLPLSPA